MIADVSFLDLLLHKIMCLKWKLMCLFYYFKIMSIALKMFPTSAIKGELWDLVTVTLTSH